MANRPMWYLGTHIKGQINQMTFEEAIKESIRKYYDKKHDDTSLESNKVTPIKYTKKYFDDFEEEQLGTSLNDVKKKVKK